MISDKHRRRNRGENGRIPTSLLLVPRPDHPSRLGSTSRRGRVESDSCCVPYGALRLVA